MACSSKTILVLCSFALVVPLSLASMFGEKVFLNNSVGVNVNNSFFYVWNSTPKNWIDAKIACRISQGSLLTINSMEENELIFASFFSQTILRTPQEEWGQFELDPDIRSVRLGGAHPQAIWVGAVRTEAITRKYTWFWLGGRIMQFTNFVPGFKGDKTWNCLAARPGISKKGAGFLNNMDLYWYPAHCAIRLPFICVYDMRSHLLNVGLTKGRNNSSQKVSMSLSLKIFLFMTTFVNFVNKAMHW